MTHPEIKHGYYSESAHIGFLRFGADKKGVIHVYHYTVKAGPRSASALKSVPDKSDPIEIVHVLGKVSYGNAITLFGSNDPFVACGAANKMGLEKVQAKMALLYQGPSVA